MKKYELLPRVTPLLLLHLGSLAVLSSAGIALLGVMLMRQRRILSYVSVFRCAVTEITLLGLVTLLAALAVAIDSRQKKKDRPLDT